MFEEAISPMVPSMPKPQGIVRKIKIEWKHKRKEQVANRISEKA